PRRALVCRYASSVLRFSLTTPGKTPLVILFDRRRDDGAPRKPPPPERPRPRGAEQRHLPITGLVPLPRLLGGQHVARRAPDRRRRATPVHVRELVALRRDLGAQHGLGLVGPRCRSLGGAGALVRRREPRWRRGAAEPVVAEVLGHLVLNTITCQPRGDGSGSRSHELSSSECFLRPLVRFASSGAGQGQPFFGLFTTQLLVPRKDCGARRKLSELPAERR
ncbi:unnamed protein product, partial [Pelagomonas calceolata]